MSQQHDRPQSEPVFSTFADLNLHDGDPRQQQQEASAVDMEWRTAEQILARRSFPTISNVTASSASHSSASPASSSSAAADDWSPEMRRRLPPPVMGTRLSSMEEHELPLPEYGSIGMQHHPQHHHPSQLHSVDYELPQVSNTPGTVASQQQQLGMHPVREYRQAHTPAIVADSAMTTAELKRASMAKQMSNPLPVTSAGHHRPGNLASLLSYEDTLELYRQNARKSSDPQTQLDFAKYLLQIADSIDTSSGQKKARKAKEALQNEGIKWIKRLATAGLGLGKPAYADAQFYLAECYGNGALGPMLPIDHDRAFNLYVQASKQNHAAATFRAAVCYELGAGPRKDYARAVQFYRKAAALGDIGGMYKLAIILLNGIMNTPKNEREGVTWLKRAATAADENHPEALHELAVVYEKGGVPSVIVDEQYARELYSKAAQLGYAPSQFKLGYCYEYGTLTCEVDARRSIAWYTRAAEQGHPEAELALSGWYLTGSEGILQQDDTEAYLWARKAAEKGFAKAEYAVGYYSEVGIGVEANLEECVYWYTRAAAQNNQRAQQRLVEIKKMNKMMQKQRMYRDRRREDNGDCVLM